MSFHACFDSLEEVHKGLMHELMENPDCESAPRGKPIRELIAASFTLTDPRNRLIRSPARAVNYGFAVGELCWYMRGDSDLATMLYYNKRMAQFSDDGVSINSAYGAYILNPSIGGIHSQWDLCVRELTADPDSRRAVMHINQPRDLWRAVSRGSRDVPCTLSLQLLIRNRRLHMHVVMRSNDVVWGLPYDVFSFTLLQEAFLHQLQEAGALVDDLGSYHHTAGSLHLYDTHYAMADQVTKETWQTSAPMKPVTLEELEWLATAYEPLCRASISDPLVPWNISFPDSSVLSFERDAEQTTLEWMAAMLVDHRDKRVIEKIEKEKSCATSQTQNSPLTSAPMSGSS
jgi:thymidylate synthase